MHRAFSNWEQATETSFIPSYQFDFPYIPLPPQKLPYSEKKREFTGMHPNFRASEELRFDSSFESGNLDLVYKVIPWEYDLYMRVDTNTRGHL